MSMMLTGRKSKNCSPKNANGWSHRCRSISVRSIPCSLMNGKKSVNDTRNMMVVISALCPVVLLVLLYDWHLCGCRRNRDDDCTELWKMIIRKSLFVSLGAFNWLLQNKFYKHLTCTFENVVEWQNLYIE